MASRRQHKKNERDYRTVVQQLISSMPQSVLMKTSYKQKEQEIGKRGKIVIFASPDQKRGAVEENPEQQSLSGEKDVKESRPVNEQKPEQEKFSGQSDVEENGHVQEQNREDKILSGVFRWMSR